MTSWGEVMECDPAGVGDLAWRTDGAGRVAPEAPPCGLGRRCRLVVKPLRRGEPPPQLFPCPTGIGEVPAGGRASDGEELECEKV